MARHRRGYVQIDINDVMDEIEDDVLLEEVRSRGLIGNDGESSDIEIVREAYEALGRGRRVEARSILERLLYPKWRSKSSCDNAYQFAFAGTDH